eukprot:591826-Amphidinium_carterae.1
MPKEALSVMSFNVRYDNNEDKNNGRGWGDRCWKVAELINSSQARALSTSSLDQFSISRHGVSER